MVNLASGTFHHFIKGPRWGPNRNLSLSIANSQPPFGVGDETNKVNENLVVNQNNTILGNLNYFLQIMSRKRIWASKKILDPLHALGFEGNPDFEFSQFCVLVVPLDKGFLEFFCQFVAFAQKLFFYTSSIHVLER